MLFQPLILFSHWWKLGQRFGSSRSFLLRSLHTPPHSSFLPVFLLSAIDQQLFSSSQGALWGRFWPEKPFSDFLWCHFWRFFKHSWKFRERLSSSQALHEHSVFCVFKNEAESVLMWFEQLQTTEAGGRTDVFSCLWLSSLMLLK